MPGPASTVLLTVTGLEALVLASRLALPKGRVEHVRLLLMVITLAVDELAAPGLPRALAMVAVITAQGNVLGPRHWMTRVQNLAAMAAIVCLAALRASGAGLWPLALLLVGGLQVFSFLQLLLERHWMGWPVFLALLVSGVVWLGSRALGAMTQLPPIPIPGLPLALSLIPAVPMWWFAPDGPHVSRWQSLAAGLEGRLASTEALLRSQSRLEALGFVAAGAAHEFRSALAGIGALAGFARNGASAVKDDALEAIRSRAVEAHRAVVPLLEQIGGGGREEATPLDLARDLGPLLSMMRATCRRDGIDMAFHTDDTPVVRARRAEVEHILMNLLRNAVEASHTRPRAAPLIHVRVLEKGSTGVVEVEDNAGGVPSERVGSLFSPQVSAPGSGVGLFIARGLAVRNGGELDYEPVPGGSRFCLRLPLEPIAGRPV